MSPKKPAESPPDHPYLERHLRFGWGTLFLFLSLGIVLETLHGFKVGWYLDVSNETRRMMWTLAHTHGTLIGLVHVAFAVTVVRCAAHSSWPRLASRALIGATVLLPGGFFLGGLGFHGGDPGLGILLVPVGALCLLVAVFATFRGARGIQRS